MTSIQDNEISKAIIIEIKRINKQLKRVIINKHINQYHINTINLICASLSSLLEDKEELQVVFLEALRKVNDD